MKIEKVAISIALVVGLLSVSCRSVPAMAAPSATLCELNADVSRVGQAVSVEAVYDTDSSTFADLVDKRCEGGSHRMRLGEDAPNADRTVARFFKARKKLCEQKGILALCSIRAEINVELVVMRDVRGRPMASLKRVLSYRFLE